MGSTSSAVSCVFRRLSLLSSARGLYWLGLAAIVYSYFRILSRNTRKRYSENLKYLSYQNRVTTWFGKQQVRFKQRKDYHYYRCPQCGQQLRVPRGRGKISITCPKCGHQFIKKS